MPVRFFTFLTTLIAASACNVGDLGLIPGSGRSPGEGNGNPLQYFCLENPMDGGAWWGRKESDTTEWLTFSLFTREGRKLRVPGRHPLNLLVSKSRKPEPRPQHRRTWPQDAGGPGEPVTCALLAGVPSRLSSWAGDLDPNDLGCHMALNFHIQPSHRWAWPPGQEPWSPPSQADGTVPTNQQEVGLQAWPSRHVHLCTPCPGWLGNLIFLYLETTKLPKLRRIN